MTAAFFGTLIIRIAPHAHKYLPVVENKNTCLAIQIGSYLLGVMFAAFVVNFILPSLNVTPGQLLVFFLWVMVPVALFSALGYGIGERSRAQHLAVNS